MNDDRDEVAELADRLLAKQRRARSWVSSSRSSSRPLTDEERERLPEKLEALRENVRVLCALLDLVESSGAPPGTTLGEALVAGYVSVLEVVEATRAVPEPLAWGNRGRSR